MFNSKEELKKWILDRLESKGKKSLQISIRNSNRIKNDLIKYTNFLPKESNFNQRCFHIINDLYEVPLCKECENNKVNFCNRDKTWKYLDFCSTTCGSNNKETQEKYKNTNIKKYGIDNYSKTDEYKNYMINKNREKYGVDWYQQSYDFKHKSEITMLEKFGTPYFSPVYGFKDYKLPSGKIVKIQGYENFALDILLEKYDESDVLISYLDIKNEIGKITYSKGKQYLPDIYLKSKNKIIEVKSEWTFEVDRDINLMKKEACINKNINFEFWIMNSKGEIISTY